MNLKFKSSKEELPKHNEFIVYIKPKYSLYGTDCKPTFTRCEYSWSDDEGTEIGHTDEYNLSNKPDRFPFLTIGDTISNFLIWDEKDKEDGFFWMSQNEYFDIVENSISQI